MRNIASYHQKAAVRTRATRARNRQYVLTYLHDHPCVDCGEEDVVVLEFDHIVDKDCKINDAIRRGFSIERLQREIDKCEVVCANCHRRRSYKRAGSYRVGTIGIG